MTDVGHLKSSLTGYDITYILPSTCLFSVSTCCLGCKHWGKWSSLQWNPLEDVWDTAQVCRFQLSCSVSHPIYTWDDSLHHIFKSNRCCAVSSDILFYCACILFMRKLRTMHMFHHTYCYYLKIHVTWHRELNNIAAVCQADVFSIIWFCYLRYIL